MLGLRATSAFIKAYPTAALSQHVASIHCSASSISTTQLKAAKLLEPAAKSLCVGFFDGFKTPATLIAGTSFASLFAFVNRAQDTSFPSKRDILFMRLYHVCSLLSFCLSLTTVLSSQAATAFLLNPQPITTKLAAGDAYQFLRNNMNLEFLVTRWAFINSILFFLKSTCFRMILEFELFSKKSRLTAGVMVVSLMTGVVLAMLSYINLSSAASQWPNLWEMTRELGMVRRCCRGG
jgi:hypothetical protein